MNIWKLRCLVSQLVLHCMKGSCPPRDKRFQDEISSSQVNFPAVLWLSTRFIFPSKASHFRASLSSAQQELGHQAAKNLTLIVEIETSELLFIYFEVIACRPFFFKGLRQEPKVLFLVLHLCKKFLGFVKNNLATRKYKYYKLTHWVRVKCFMPESWCKWHLFFLLAQSNFFAHSNIEHLLQTHCGSETFGIA